MKKITLLILIFIAFASKSYGQFPTPYCAEAFASGVEPITLVNFAGINNISDPSIGTVNPAHEDFTSMIGNVVAGSTYGITLKGNTDGNFTTKLRVYIDWNQNNDFTDAGESYDIGNIVNSTGLDAVQLTGTILVPVNALAGNTRMRVIKKFNAFSTACNTLGYGQAEDYSLTVTIPSCFSPLGGIATVTSTSASLSWTSGGATNAEVFVQLAGLGVPSDTDNTGVNVSTSTYSVTGLTSQTAYEFYVRDECSIGSSFSTWAGPYLFTTACGSITSLPWTENFDSLTAGTNVFPLCWAYENTLSTWAISTTPVAYSGANSLRRTWSTDGWAYTPLATLNAGTSYTLSYYMRTNDAVVGYDLTVGVGNGQTAAAMTTTLSTVTGYQNPTWTKFTFEFIPTVTGEYSYGVHVVAPAAPNGINFDDFKLELTPSCVEPMSLVASNVTSATAMVSWTAPTVAPAIGYEYFISTSNTAPLATDAATGSIGVGITMADLASLTPATTYYVWVRSVCSSSDTSSWSSSLSFVTECVAVTSFSENFDSALAFPTCWGKVGTIGTAYIQTANPSSAPNTLYIYGSGVMPVVKTVPVSNLGTGTNRLKFDMRANFTVGGIIQIGYLTDPNDSTTFIALGSVTASSLTYTQYVFTPDVGSYSDHLALRHKGTPGNSVLIDNVVWEEIPSCVEPTLLVVSSITSATAMVSWTAPAVAPVNGYQYFVSTSNTPPDVSTVATGSVLAGITMADLSNLTSATLYYVWVRSICNGSDVSSWSVSSSFNTGCIAATVPYTQDFESAFVPALPICTSNENVGTGNNWITVANPGSGFTTKALQYSYSTPSAANTWFYTQPITLTAGTSYSIGYNYGNNSATYIESLKVAYGTSANSSSMTTTLANYPSVTGATLLSDSIAFTPAVSGDYYFGFNAYSVADQFYLFVDDIAVTATPLATQSFNSSSFSYYPNPVKNTLNLSYSENISDVSVYNLLGQQVIAKAINANQSQIDMSHLTSGTYMVKVTANNQVKTIKVIKE